MKTNLFNFIFLFVFIKFSCSSKHDATSELIYRHHFYDSGEDYYSPADNVDFSSETEFNTPNTDEFTTSHVSSGDLDITNWQSNSSHFSTEENLNGTLAEGRSSGGGNDDAFQNMFTKADEEGWNAVVTSDYPDDCKADELVCDDGKCINTSMICNGVVDCKSGEDEDPLICEDIDSEKQHRDKQMADKKLSQLAFTCDNGELIPLENAYDTIEDCNDGSDETDRGQKEKLERCFQCDIDTMCLDPNVTCDQIIDCPNGADEDEISCKDKYLDLHGINLDRDYPPSNRTEDQPFIIFNSIEPIKKHGLIMLTCDVNIVFLDSDIQNVKWYKDGILFNKLMLNESRYQVDDSLLHVSDVQDGDLGVYKCVVTLTNGTVVSKTRKIDYTTGDYDTFLELVEEGVSTEQPEVDEDHNPEALPEFASTDLQDAYSEKISTDDQSIRYVPNDVDDIGYPSEYFSSGDTQQQHVTDEYYEGEYLSSSTDLEEEDDERDLSDSDIAATGYHHVANQESSEAIPFTEHSDHYPQYEVVESEGTDIYSDHRYVPTDRIQTTEIYYYSTDENAHTIARTQDPSTYNEWMSEFKDYISSNPPFYEKVSANRGDSIVLRCPILAMVPIENVRSMYWKHNDDKIPMEVNVNSKLGMTTKEATLEDSGEWQCFLQIADNGDGYFISYTEVDVKDTDSSITTDYDLYPIEYDSELTPVQQTTVHPKDYFSITEWIRTTPESDVFTLKAFPSHVRVVPHSTVTVSCLSDEVPPAVNIYFLKTDPYGLAIGEVYKHHIGTYANYTLKIRDVSEFAFGKYQCIAVTPDRRAVKADFEISPDFVDGGYFTSTELKDDMKRVDDYTEFIDPLQIKDSLFPLGIIGYMQCLGVEPQNYNRIEWMLNEQPIDVPSKGFIPVDDTLFIRNVSPDTAGIYTCRVMDHVGGYRVGEGKLLIQDGASQVPVRYDPPEKINVDRRTQSLQYGAPLVLTCSSNGPTQSFTWIKVKDGVSSVIGNTPRLTIPSVTDVGDVIYKCQIVDYAGQSYVLPIFVHTDPAREQISYSEAPSRDRYEDLRVNIAPHSPDVQYGDIIQLICRCNIPDARIQWEKILENEVPVYLTSNSTLIILIDSDSKFGRYRCSAEIYGQPRAHQDTLIRLVADMHQPPYREWEPAETSKDEGAVLLRRCNLDEATCRDGTCIKRNKVCDGVNDCPDGTDEKGCGRASQVEGECHPDQYLCENNKQCIQKIWLCDGENDCDDGSDESSLHCDRIATSPLSSCKASQFQCLHHNFTQCIPKAYVCDETVDCADQSDEIGCVKPTVIVPPESEKLLNRGETLTLKCIARGNPLPFINWRLNWGFVCGDGLNGGRCVMTQEVDPQNQDIVIGTLTIHNMQPSDSGAYSCEAINSKGFHFAVPDAFVQVRLSTSEPDQCHTVGTSLQAGPGCQCKLHVTGERCSRCRFGFYDLSPDVEGGCRRCYCSGVTKQCSSDIGRYKTVKVNLVNSKYPWKLVHSDGSIDKLQTIPISVNPVEDSLTVQRFDVSPTIGTLYWQPSEPRAIPLGNMISSYGGNLRIVLKKTSHTRQLSIDDAVVLMTGHGIDIIYQQQGTVELDSGIFTLTIPITEDSFQRMDLIPLDRLQFMSILSNVERFLIWAGDSVSYNGQCSLLAVTFELARADGDGRSSTAVEKCTCPRGYSGSSCEVCQSGYTRKYATSESTFECYPCLEHCNRKSNQCHPDSGKCSGCADNTDGERCQDCIAGYTRDSRTGQCVSAANYEQDSPSLIIDDQPYDPNRKIIVIVKPGERKIIRVTAKDPETIPSTVWLRVDSSGQRKQLPEGMQQVGMDLIIDNAIPNVAGVYEAHLRMKNGRLITPNVVVQYVNASDVTVNPTLQPEGIIRKQINEPVTIQIQPNGFPIHRVIWTKDNMPLPSHVIQDYYRISIDRLVPELCGNYEATLIPELGVEPVILRTTIECQTYDPYQNVYDRTYLLPKISLSPSEVYLNPGQAMVVSYEIRGEQPVNIVWNRVIDTATGHQLQSIPHGFQVLKDRLILEDTRVSDAGMYKVTATNRYGKDDAILVVHVQNKYNDQSVDTPEVRFERTIYEIQPGQTMRIEPIITCNSPYITSWSDGYGNQLPVGIRQEGNALVISSMIPEIAGSYIIEVATMNTKIRVPIEIEIKENSDNRSPVRFHPAQSAKLEAYLPSKITTGEGESFTVKCEIHGNEQNANIKFTWMKHSHEPTKQLPSHIQAKGPILTGQNVQLSDYAYYICSAKILDTGEESIAYTLLDVQSMQN